MLEFGLGLGVQSGIGNNTPIIQGASFDGTNDYLLRGATLTGVTDSKLTIIAARFKMLSLGVTQTAINSSGNHIIFGLSASNTLLIIGINSVGTTILNASTSIAITDNEYHNVLVGIDMANQVVSFIYTDDVESSIYTTFTNDSIGYGATTNYSIGATVGGGNKSHADIHSLYANFSETLDFSIEANRRKFFDVDGVPVYLGENGELPTGTAPNVYFAGPYDQWHINKGTGGGFTVTGALERPLP